MPIGRRQRIAVRPVHLELPVGIFVIVLVRAPPQRLHVVADLGDEPIAAHQSELVVARFALMIARIGDARAIAREQNELALDARPHGVSELCRPLHLARKDPPRGLFDRFTAHHELARDPRDLGLPGELNHALGVGHREHVRVGRCHVEPSGKACKARSFSRDLVDARRGHQLRALHTA